MRFENAVHTTSLDLQIVCIRFEAQISSLAQVCRLFSSLILLTIEHLVDFPPPNNSDNQTEIWLWSRPLQPFTVVADLYLPPGNFVSRCADNARSQRVRLRRTIPRATEYFRTREPIIVGCAGLHHDDLILQ
jgi:hypothetical protein